MCTYLTEKVAVEGSGKGPGGWFRVTDATAYVDHPVHAPYGHTVNVDFLNPELGPSARVAVELTEEAAMALVGAITRALAAAPPGIASREAERSLRSDHRQERSSRSDRRR